MRNCHGFAWNFDPDLMGSVLDPKTRKQYLNFYLTVGNLPGECAAEAAQGLEVGDGG